MWKDILELVARRFGSKRLQEMVSKWPQGVRDNWLAAFGDISKDGKVLSKGPHIATPDEYYEVFEDDIGDWFSPRDDFSEGLGQIYIWPKHRQLRRASAITHEGLHNMDNVTSILNNGDGPYYYATDIVNPVRDAKGDVINYWSDVEPALLPKLPSEVSNRFAPFNYGIKRRIAEDAESDYKLFWPAFKEAKAQLVEDPHILQKAREAYEDGAISYLPYYETRNGIDENLVGAEGLAQLNDILSLPKYTKLPPIKRVIEHIESEPLLNNKEYNINFDVLSNEVDELAPVLPWK